MLNELWRFKLYVPADCLCLNDKRELHKDLIQCASGFTAYQSQGFWRNSSGDICVEQVDVYEVIGPKTLAPMIGSLADDVKVNGQQESVLWTCEEIQAEFA